MCDSLFGPRRWISHEISSPGSLDSPHGKYLGEKQLQKMKVLGIWLLPIKWMTYSQLLRREINLQMPSFTLEVKSNGLVIYRMMMKYH